MRPAATGVVDLVSFEFLDRLAALAPRPRKHRHRYHEVFAQNHRLMRGVNALRRIDEPPVINVHSLCPTSQRHVG